jgi:sugar phosphate isomerase/epimerase
MPFDIMATVNSRRDFLYFAAATAFPLLAKINSEYKGVIFGAQSYSFRDRSLDEAIEAYKQCGLGYAELFSGHVEPRNEAERKKWRTSPESIQQAKQIKKKFDQAGVRIYAFNYSFRKNHTDEEVLHGMRIAKAMGTKFITASSTVDQAKRLNDLAAREGVFVAMHNHSNVKDPNEFATPESFYKAMEGNPHIRINLDIGHFVAANYDPVEFIQKNYRNIVTLHIKDRKKNQGPNVPFGEGDTPIKEVLQLLQKNRWKIPAMIEYEYKGGDTIAEVKRCYEYCRKVLG